MIRSALALSVAAVGAVPGAQAQEAKKLFFEGDIVRHALADQAGPFCVLANQFKRKEAVAWRIRVLEPNGKVADNTVLKSVVVELGNGQKLPAGYGARHAADRSFLVPALGDSGRLPDRLLGYKVVATMMDDSTVAWEPFNRATTQLMVVAGEPEMKK